MFRRTDFLNTPMRTGRGPPVISREFNFFKQISELNTSIDIHDLITAFKTVMHSHNLDASNAKECYKQLLAIKLPDSQSLVNEHTHTIMYASYAKSWLWVLQSTPHSAPIGDLVLINKRCQMNWRKYGLVMMLGVVDCISIGSIIITGHHLPAWLIVSRSCAVIILVNLACILMPMIKLSNLIPDYILARAFPSEYSTWFHRVFGIKVLVFGVVHTIGHIIHVQQVINNCVDGCSRDEVRVVPKSDVQIRVSYAYFASQFPYITGVVLVFTFGVVAIVATANQYKLIRFGTNQTLHKIFTVVSIIMVIVHGCAQLLGINLSFILTLPLLTLYLWYHRYEIFKYKVRIARHVITPSLVKLYLDDNRYENMLDRFSTATIYINHDRLSRWEWHPFTLSKKRNSHMAIITIKRVGDWTNKLANLLTNRVDFSESICVGHIIQSKFRFHNLYRIRYFFCAGIGITAFISAMRDSLKTNNYTSVLYWSISEIDIIKEFNAELMFIKNEVRNTEIRIFYSNSRHSAKTTVPESAKSKFVYLQSVIFGKSGYDIVAGCISPSCCVFKRVDFISLLTTAILRHRFATKGQTIGVLVCGPQRYVDHARSSVDLLNRNEYRIKLQLWSEGV